MQIPIVKSWKKSRNCYCNKFFFSLAKKLIEIVIPLIKLDNVPVGGYCKLNKQCQENEHFVECKFGRCVCKTGYVLYNLECHKGKLELLFKKYILKGFKEGHVSLEWIYMLWHYLDKQIT